jgi:hypothetical protein
MRSSETKCSRKMITIKMRLWVKDNKVIRPGASQRLNAGGGVRVSENNVRDNIHSVHCVYGPSKSYSEPFTN